MIKVLIFGAGDYSKRILKKIEDKYEVVAFIDNQIEKKNTYYEGINKYRIIAPEEMKKFEFEKVIIASINYSAEMFQQLLGLGVREHDIIVDYICTVTKVYIYDFLKMQINQFYENNRLDIAVKFLAIENYYLKNNYGYELYIEMQKKRLNINTSEAEVMLDKFKNLIKSFEERGLDDDSYIICDSKMRIMDGAHRIALCLYFGILHIKVKILPKNFNCEYSKEWFWENYFKLDDIKKICDKYEGFYNYDRDEMIAVLWPPMYKYFDEATREMSELVEVNSVVDKEFTHGILFHNVVRSVYAIDDIAEWKIQKKIEYMGDYEPRIRIISFYLKKPYYRLKGDTSLPLSVKVERIKKIIRKRYKEKVNPYYYDIIIHISDNYFQSYEMKNLLLCSNNIYGDQP